ncbi:hypothetical protein HCU64_23250 [Methylobacterium sp. C25]|uniref:hypothetical protein n=1 Tax=Methylobacterium sp. C25 TaxID=2721622 RepID=UPI001F32CD12|nr:hypothetical protein [Methylobacterium sp. C25]MCE4226663.1 hypothetical protein [Methylobacterium sp. C25]
MRRSFISAQYPIKLADRSRLVFDLRLTEPPGQSEVNGRDDDAEEEKRSREARLELKCRLHPRQPAAKRGGGAVKASFFKPRRI